MSVDVVDGQAFHPARPDGGRKCVGCGADSRVVVGECQDRLAAAFDEHHRATVEQDDQGARFAGPAGGPPPTATQGGSIQFAGSQAASTTASGAFLLRSSSVRTQFVDGGGIGELRTAQTVDVVAAPDLTVVPKTCSAL